jgi:hypothetical protein
MKWTNLHPVLRRAIMREAVRRGVAIDQLFLSLGGAL